jgi:hypothetical protein
MRHRWPEDTRFTRLVLEVEDNVCAVCGGALHICDHRRHRIFTLQGPVEVVCKLAHCADRRCAAHTKTRSPYAETTLTLPWWLIGWDVFCWMGHRRFARHWSVPQSRSELADSYQIPLSADAIEDAVRRYQTMLAARQQDPQVVAAAYRNVEALVLSIDGLQPEKGHETLYVVRELNAKRIWFAEALLSSNADEVRRLLSQARAWATQVGLPVHLWLSDKQDAFVTGIAAEFPGVPHRYCVNHFLRDLAKPMLETDRHAKVKMRSKVRGLRAIEREILQQRQLIVAEAPAVAPVTMPPAPPPQRTRWPRTSPSRRNHRRMPARSCWITVVPCVVFLMTIRGGRYNRPAYAWRRPWETSVRLSNATSMPTVAAARTPNSSAWPDVSTAA